MLGRCVFRQTSALGWLCSLGQGRAGWRDLGEPERRHQTAALSLEGGGRGRKGAQGRRDGASKGTAAWGCRAGDSMVGDGTTVDAGPGRRSWAWQGPRQGPRETKSRAEGGQPHVSEGRCGNLQEDARGNIHIKEFPGCSGLGPATALHNFDSGFSPRRSCHHLPSPNTPISSLRYLGTPDRGGYLGGTLMQGFVGQAVLQWFVLGPGEHSGVPEANQGFQGLPGKP